MPGSEAPSHPRKKVATVTTRPTDVLAKDPLGHSMRPPTSGAASASDPVLGSLCDPDQGVSLPRESASGSLDALERQLRVALRLATWKRGHAKRTRAPTAEALLQARDHRRDREDVRAGRSDNRRRRRQRDPREDATPLQTHAAVSSTPTHGQALPGHQRAVSQVESAGGRPAMA